MPRWIRPTGFDETVEGLADAFDYIATPVVAVLDKVVDAIDVVRPIIAAVEAVMSPSLFSTLANAAVTQLDNFFSDLLAADGYWFPIAPLEWRHAARPYPWAQALADVAAGLHDPLDPDRPQTSSTAAWAAVTVIASARNWADFLAVMAQLQNFFGEEAGQWQRLRDFRVQLREDSVRRSLIARGSSSLAAWHFQAKRPGPSGEHISVSCVSGPALSVEVVESEHIVITITHESTINDVWVAMLISEPVMQLVDVTPIGYLGDWPPMFGRTFLGEQGAHALEGTPRDWSRANLVDLIPGATEWIYQARSVLADLRATVGSYSAGLAEVEQLLKERLAFLQGLLESVRKLATALQAWRLMLPSLSILVHGASTGGTERYLQELASSEGTPGGELVGGFTFFATGPNAWAQVQSLGKLLGLELGRIQASAEGAA